MRHVKTYEISIKDKDLVPGPWHQTGVELGTMTASDTNTDTNTNANTDTNTNANTDANTHTNTSPA